tara:strand:- start:113 stop:628 length:516 start_codon:yes stop_codon:yes gene_type:complete
MNDQGQVSPQPLVVPFDQRSGEMMVYGGGFAALFVLSIAIARAAPAYYAASFVLAGIAFHFLPFVSKKTPALVISSAGLKISGVGLLDWRAVKRAEIINKSVRTIRNAELHLTLNRPLAEAVLSPDAEGLIRHLKVQIARREKDVLIVKLEPLGSSPEAILETVTRFLSQH